MTFSPSGTELARTPGFYSDVKAASGFRFIGFALGLENSL